MIVKIQPEVHKKSHVVFYVHIDGIFQGDNLQFCIEIPERHIRISGGLVIVKIQPEVHKKSHVVFYVHIDGIFQGDNLQFCIRGPVDSITET